MADPQQVMASLSLTSLVIRPRETGQTSPMSIASIYTIKQTLKHLTDRSIKDSGGASLSLLGKGPVLVKNVFGTSNRKPNQEWFNQIGV